MKVCAALFVIDLMFSAIGGLGDGLAPLDHLGVPLSEIGDPKGITIASASYPAKAANEMVSKDGHRCVLEVRMGGAGHTNDTTFYFHSPAGKELKLEFQPTYGDTSEYHWINEDLFFVRIWWGRHWGSDYIFDVDTQKIVYAEGIAEHHESIKPGQ